jgi:hypothetical protein
MVSILSERTASMANTSLLVAELRGTERASPGLQREATERSCKSITTVGLLGFR